MIVLSGKDSKTIGNTMEETKERHLRYLRATNSPVRRDILRALKDKPLTVDELLNQIKLDEKTLNWHLSILEWGYCIEKESRNDVLYYNLTQEGKIVDYVDK